MKINNNVIQDNTFLSIGSSNNSKSSNIKASSLKLVSDPVAQRKAEAQKQAMKIIGDAYAGDKKIDGDLAARRDRIHELQLETRDYSNAIKSIENQRVALRESFGVDPDSQEEKDL